MGQLEGMRAATDPGTGNLHGEGGISRAGPAVALQGQGLMSQEVGVGS